MGACSIRRLHDLVGSTWVFQIKDKLDGSIELYKIGLVAHKYKQQYGINYKKTLNPIIKFQTIIFVAISNNRQILQIDVKYGFYFVNSMKSSTWNNHRVSLILTILNICRLKKPLYGLKQEPQVWFYPF